MQDATKRKATDELLAVPRERSGGGGGGNTFVEIGGFLIESSQWGR